LAAQGNFWAEQSNSKGRDSALKNRESGRRGRVTAGLGPAPTFDRQRSLIDIFRSWRSARNRSAPPVPCCVSNRLNWASVPASLSSLFAASAESVSPPVSLRRLAPSWSRPGRNSSRTASTDVVPNDRTSHPLRGSARGQPSQRRAHAEAAEQDLESRSSCYLIAANAST
jgi:hypothetical protein